MTLSVVFRPEAAEDASIARRWYDEQKPGLGARFTDAIDETIQRMVANPMAFPVVHRETRRAVVRRFPYGIYFQIATEHIVVVAVMHGRRHPRRWRARQ